ncbi:MAG: pitrilysin family protein [Myxococcota bacterium]|nr:pitrilysin family protein [Myxococcota bacterium]
MKWAISFFTVLMFAIGCGGGQVQKQGGPDRSKLPGPAAASPWSQPEIETWTLSNGLNVWFVRQTQAPLLAIQLVFPKGSATDPGGRAGTTALMVDLLDEGADGLSALELSDAFSQLATDYSVRVDIDSATLSMSLLADKLDASLSLLAKILTKPGFAETDFNRVKAQRDARALTSESNPSSVAFVVARRVMNGSGYGAYSPNGVRKTLAQVTRKDVQLQYEKLIKPNGATVVVVGDCERTALEAALENNLGQWTGRQVESPIEPSTKPSNVGIRLVDFPGSSQSMVIAIRQAEGAKAPDYFQSEVFNKAFAGAFTARVNMNLREDKGYTYGARGAFMRLLDDGAYLIYAKVKGETTKASIDEILKEIRLVSGDKPITADEVESAKSSMIKGIPGRFERMGNVAGELGGLVAKKRGLDWYHSRMKKVAQVSLSMARDAAQKHAVAEQFQIIVAGDKAKILDGLKTFGLPIFLYDAQGDYLGPLSVDDSN